MATFDYNPIVESITITYQCPACGKINISDSIGVPMPDFNAEKPSESERYESDEILCEKCGFPHQVSLMTRYDGGWGEVLDLDDDLLMNVKEDFGDENFYTYEDFEELSNEYIKLLNKIPGLSPEEEQLLCQLFYLNIITRMEAYLGDTLKKNVLQDNNSIRNFVEKYKDFADESVRLPKLYEKLDSLPSFIRDILNDISYHNLPKVKPIFKDILSVDLGFIGNLCKAVKKRHDIVHRNGKTNDGTLVQINRSDIQNLWEEVSEMIERVEAQLASKHQNSTSLRSK